ncbi:ABC transporter substrate-binding protein [Pigmentiphaga soli]|uniref:ABC transporter substrate-binding protein n=1 Tax=Pigmentiphaga soli TaxID=1007095 RepID=A0ABP8HRT0_9BURK
MAKLSVSLACCDYDRTKALFDGRVGIEGCDVNPVIIEPEEAFHRAFRDQEFDITEISLSSHTMTTSRGENPYVAIPAFVSRVFRHSGIYIRTDRGIGKPEDLAGRTIGIPEYQITANVWIRGLLQDEYGVDPASIDWRRGGTEQPGRNERAPIKLPPEIRIQQIPADRSLSQMLEAGELDAVFSARAPSCLRRGAPNVGRLFPDYRRVEQAYFERTGIFPIMHMIGIRRSLAEQHPWLAVSVYKAFLEAKEICTRQIGDIGQLWAHLPWAAAEYEDTVRLMGRDYWSYGVAENHKTLDTLARYSFEQHLSARRVAVEELFAPSTLELSKI